MSGRRQAAAQLDDRGRSPPIVGLGHPTALVPHIPQEVLPLTVQVDIPIITPFPLGAFHHTTHSALIGKMLNIPPTLQTRTPTNEINLRLRYHLCLPIRSPKLVFIPTTEGWKAELAGHRCLFRTVTWRISHTAPQLLHEGAVVG